MKIMIPILITSTFIFLGFKTSLVNTFTQLHNEKRDTN